MRASSRRQLRGRGKLQRESGSFVVLVAAVDTVDDVVDMELDSLTSAHRHVGGHCGDTNVGACCAGWL